MNMIAKMNMILEMIINYFWKKNNYLMNLLLKHKINTLSYNIKFDKLTYYFKSGGRKSIGFNNFNCPLDLIRKIKNGSIDLEKVRKNFKKYKSNLIETWRGKWKYKPEEQESTKENLNMFFEAREKVIKFFDNYATILSKAKYEAKYGKGFKILTPKQMLQRLPIAFA